jgi:hypothetical protein
MDPNVTSRLLKTGLALSCCALALASCATDASNAEREDTTANSGLPREAAGASANLLSAFFGLDNGLPLIAHRICLGAGGKDGMPVIFSEEIDHTTMQAGDFQVTTAGGATGAMHCVSLLPATDAGELRTVLLIGDFGDAGSDPPTEVRVVGNLHSLDGTRNFKGASVAVTPLALVPELVLAERVSDEAVDMGLGMRRTRGSRCPADGVTQAIRVVWAGGVTLANGKEPGDAERQLYKVVVQSEDGKQRDVVPVALADLGDGDNNHVLCLDTADRAVSVALPAGVLRDPNGDLNPQTSVSLAH